MIGTVRLSNEKIGIEQTNLLYKFEEVALYFKLKTTLHFNIGTPSCPDSVTKSNIDTVKLNIIFRIRNLKILSFHISIFSILNNIIDC